MIILTNYPPFAFLFYLPVWLFFLVMIWIGIKIIDLVTTFFTERIIKCDSFICGLIIWTILSLFLAIIQCFVISNYGAQLKRYDFIRLVYVTLNSAVLYFTFWKYETEKSIHKNDRQKIRKKPKNRNIILFVFFNLIGHLMGLIVLNFTPLSISENLDSNILLMERNSSLVSLITVILFCLILILIQNRKLRIKLP